MRIIGLFDFKQTITRKKFSIAKILRRCYYEHIDKFSGVKNNVTHDD